MSVKTYETYTYETAENTFPLPFNPEGDPQHVFESENGLRVVLAFLVPDCDGQDPFDSWDGQGEFYQFDRSYKHDTPQPDADEFKRIIRANPGRVFTVCTCGDGYQIDEGPFTIKDTKGKDCKAEEVENAAGYYIADEQATGDTRADADSCLKTYSQWCEGEVYGICVWSYERKSIADEWDEPERDECWGCYGHDGYTAEELESQFKYAAYGNDPCRENSKQKGE